MAIKNRRWGLILVSLLMIIFGLAEIVTGFTGNFVNLLTLTPNAISTYSAVIIGIIYAVGGLLLITMKKQNAEYALICLYAVIAGRVLLVLTGIYPLNSSLQVVGIIVGTGLAIIFALYVRAKLKMDTWRT